MRRTVTLGLFVLAVFLVSGALAWAGGPAPLAITKGPWVQNVTTNAITVMWQTNNASDSRVDYGPTTSYGQYVYDATQVTLHELRVTSLSLDALYHYKATSVAGTSVSSADNTFQTAVAASTPFRFVAYGDTRTNAADHAAVVSAIIASNPRVVLHNGDFVDTGSKDSYWVSAWFTPAAPLIADVVVFPALGNHEGNATLYYNYFDPPDGGGDYNERWYSFNYGNAHFTVLDTEAPYTPGSAQYNWLVNDLQSAVSEWLFVMHHRPPYSSGEHGGTESPNLETYLVPLYEQYGVDMVFNGHDHDYERSLKSGVYYIVAGGGGAPLRNVNVTPNPYQQYAESVYHHCTIDVNGTSATLRAVRNDGSVLDTVTMTHGAGGPPIANFIGNPTSGTAPLTVAFTDTSSGSPTSWSWTFGDSGASTAQNPSHSYAAGTYTVSLTATNQYGSDSETKSNYITVTSGGAQDYTCASLTVNKGTLKSGDHTSVHTSDDAYLVIGSAKVSNKQTATVSYTYNTGLSSLSSLTVTVEGKVSAGTQPLTVYAYNYSTSSWTSIATGTLTTTDSTVNPTVSSPASYLSGGTVQVQVKAGGSGSTAFDHSTDLVKITAAP
jgi:PKD repeat protein